jgi:hypothetical protein
MKTQPKAGGRTVPRFVKANFIGPAAREALERDVSGKVHSIFERAFNIMINGKLVGIARNDVARSPINVITDVCSSESMSSLGVHEEMQVRSGGDRVLVGDVLEISLEDAELWRPRTRAEGHIDFEIVGRNLELAKRLAARKNEREGLGQLLPHVDEIASELVPHISDPNQVVEAALAHLVNLIKSVRANDVQDIEQSARKLIGLGPGLSPSADDTLAGFMAACWWVANSLGRELDRVREINKTIVGRKGGTTSMSQQLLEHAAIGKTNEAVGEFIESILVGTAADVKSGVERVLEIGETSGTDTAVGVLLGLNLSLSMYGSQISTKRKDVSGYG